MNLYTVASLKILVRYGVFIVLLWTSSYKARSLSLNYALDLDIYPRKMSNGSEPVPWGSGSDVNKTNDACVLIYNLWNTMCTKKPNQLGEKSEAVKLKLD